MNKKNYLLPFLLLLIIVFASCGETKEVGKYDNWRPRNEAFIDSLKQVFEAKTDLELMQIIPYAEKNYPIYAKKLKALDEGDVPVYTDSVSVYYKGMLINEAVFGAAPAPRYYTKLYESLDVFDKNFDGDDPGEFDSPTHFLVSKMIPGWTEVLQRMRVGERWEVYIPWQQAYGSTGSGSILGYSALIFDIQLEEIVK
ncbi:FKBP-type peptidyl-prolyl cis-trans isomerase [uncultured Bacteroides sp.]|uniref:FKBP-type peptidyl-prolyl cis-trans isomerase n=1 Tax=uncultured Bacteroides sp. TaxID=162156 RepID=UPI002AA80474|nr:FKBP-type peptidyl-prolyl cis-trans isomerase [uncultured Bacteroides sp.]